MSAVLVGSVASSGAVAAAASAMWLGQQRDVPRQHVIGVGLASGAVGLAAALRPSALVIVALGALVVIAASAVQAHRSDIVTAPDLAAALEVLAQAMRSGSSPRIALAEAAADLDGPVANDFAALVRRTNNGLPLSDVIAQWPAMRPGVAGIGLASAALGQSLEGSGSPAQAVDDVADTIRSRHELDAEVRALAAQARSSALLIGVLPLGFVAVAAATDTATVSFLTTTANGRIVLASGLLLDVAGWMWMRRIVAGVQR